MKPTTARRLLPIVVAGLVAVGSMGIVSARSLEGHSSPGTIEGLQRALQSEFSQAGDALRERLTRENAGDRWGAERAARAAAAHRSRYLAVRRELATLTPAVPAGARRSPFVPDTGFVATRWGNVIEESYGLTMPVTPPQLRVAAATPRPAWDLYRSGDGVSAKARASDQEAGSAPTQLPDQVHASWGMYARPDRASAATGNASQVVKTSASRGDPFVNGTAPSPPFFVYRDPTGGTESR